MTSLDHELLQHKQHHDRGVIVLETPCKNTTDGQMRSDSKKSSAQPHLQLPLLGATKDEAFVLASGPLFLLSTANASAQRVGGTNAVCPFKCFLTRNELAIRTQLEIPCAEGVVQTTRTYQCTGGCLRVSRCLSVSLLFMPMRQRDMSLDMDMRPVCNIRGVCTTNVTTPLRHRCGNVAATEGFFAIAVQSNLN